MSVFSYKEEDEMTKVFVDGSAGTTGLRIKERLAGRRDIELTVLDESVRKDASARKEAINGADVVFLCLPDDAAKESVSLCENPDVIIIDTSTAHRTHPAWTYGFPELTGMREKIASSKRIANPGCHASGFISLIAPLKEAGIIKHDMKLSCFSLTGYSGGGKKMIMQYEQEERNPDLDSPRMYGLSQSHKHLPEMAKYCGLYYDPVFIPVVGDFYAGMEVTVPLFSSEIGAGADVIKEVYREYYKNGLVSFGENADEDGFLCTNALADKDTMEIGIFGNRDRILLVSRFDNLGKGASGAAVQNMNIALGIDEKTGLNL